MSIDMKLGQVYSYDNGEWFVLRNSGDSVEDLYEGLCALGIDGPSAANMAEDLRDDQERSVLDQHAELLPSGASVGWLLMRGELHSQPVLWWAVGLRSGHMPRHIQTAHIRKRDYIMDMLRVAGGAKPQYGI